MKRFVGWCLVASPFVVFTMFMVAKSSVLVALGVWGAVLLVVGVIYVGVQLVNE